MSNFLSKELDKHYDRRVKLRLQVDKLEAAIQRVRELHKPIATQYSNGKEYTGCALCGDEGWDENFYHHEYPCDTIKALEGEQ
jgi:predicted phosphohydrolase